MLEGTLNQSKEPKLARNPKKNIIDTILFERRLYTT